jgi:DeoR family fructose operon transcriptional repressor
MLKAERQEHILNYINKKRKATVDMLITVVSASRATITRDLAELEKKKLIYRTHGGALSISSQLSNEVPYEQKRKMNPEIKKELASVAINLINDDDVIIIDSGSTTCELAKLLNNKRLKVFTNDIAIAMLLSNNNKIDTYVTSGMLQKDVYTLVSSEAIDFFSRIKVNSLFLSADALIPESGIYNHGIDEAKMKSNMINAADNVYLMIDNSKLHNKALMKVCDIEAITAIIINDIDDDLKHFFESHGLKVYAINS